MLHIKATNACSQASPTVTKVKDLPLEFGAESQFLIVIPWIDHHQSLEAPVCSMRI